MAARRTAHAGPPGGPLAGQRILVTGAAKRIGATVAQALAAAGADVALHHRGSAQEAGRLAAKLRTAGATVALVQGDLAAPADRARVVPEAAEGLGGPLTGLVNNASSFPERRLSDLDWEAFTADMAVNAWAPFELTQRFAQQLPARSRGAVVNFLDARIVDEDRRHVGYHFAKRTLADFTRLCALDLAPRIRVNGIGPGPTLPPPGMPAKEGAALMERLRVHLPLKAPNTPQDLADGVVYLMSAKSVTGQVLFVDGGRHLGRPMH